MSPSFSIQELGIGLKARYHCASLLPQLPLVLLDVAFLAIQQLDPKPVALLANDLERDATRYGGHDCAVVIGLRTNGDAILSAPANLHHVRGRSGHVCRGGGERVLLDHHAQLSERVAEAQASRHPVEATLVVVTVLELKRLIVKLLRLTPITDYLIEDREVDQHFGAVSVLIVNRLVDGVSLVDPQRLRELGGPFTQAFELLVPNLLELEFPKLEMRCQVVRDGVREVVRRRFHHRLLRRESPLFILTVLHLDGEGSVHAPQDLAALGTHDARMDLHEALSLQATHVPRVLPPVLGIRALLPRRLICHREAHGTYHDGVNAEDLTDLRRLCLVEQARLCEPLLLQDLRQPASLDERKHVRERSLLQGLSLLRVLDGAKQARCADVLDPALLLKQLRSENVGEGTAIRPLAGEVQNSDLFHAGKDLLWWDEDEDARLLVHDGRRSSDQNSTCQQRDHLDGQHTAPPGWAPRRRLDAGATWAPSAKSVALLVVEPLPQQFTAGIASA